MKKELLSIILLICAVLAIIIFSLLRPDVPEEPTLLEEFYQEIDSSPDNTVYEYRVTNVHLPSDTESSKSGISVRIDEIIYLNLLVRSIVPDQTESFDYLLGGGGTSVYITITASDGSVLYLESDGSYNRYTLTLPDGTEEKAFCTCYSDYLTSFLTALLCNS